MLRQRIYLPSYDWEVVVYYESDYRDATEILRELNDVGVDEYTYIKAKSNLSSGYKDTGLTFSNLKDSISVVVLSKTTTKAQFADTWFHEVMHCAEHIARAHDLPCSGEPIAYIGGELARSMQPVAARLMCPTCD